MSGEKNIVLLVNDVRPEYIEAFYKLEKKLNRKLEAIVLIDEKVKKAGGNLEVANSPFKEVVCSFSKKGSLQRATKAIYKNVLIAACQSERNQPYLRKLIPFLPFTNLTTESSLRWATSKSAMRQLLSNFDDSLAPKFVVCKSADENIKRLTEGMNFPLIVKPTGLAESILVTKCHNYEFLEKTIKYSFSVVDEIYQRDKGRGKPGFIIEEFMEGDMYSIDAYIDAKGNVYHLPLIKVTTAASIGLVGYYSYRNDSLDEDQLSRLDVDAANKAVTAAMHALKLRSSAAHVELFLTPHGWKIIELGPRIGGYRQDMYAIAYGIDHAYNEFLIKSGFEPEINRQHVAYSNIANVYAEEEGIIETVEGFEAASKLPSVKWLMQYAKPGDTALFSTNGGKYIIDGVLGNVSKEKLEKDVNKLRELIKITVKPF